MEHTPEFRDDRKMYSKTPPSKEIAPKETSSCTTVTPVAYTKQVATALFVTFFAYRPYRNGARKAPARAPHETPIICAINVMLKRSFRTAITAETITKNTMKIRMTRTFFFSVNSFFEAGAITSSVSVELEVRTSEESVDIEAARTSTITMAITRSGSSRSMAGMMESNRIFPSFLPMYWESANRRPKPPRK